MDASLYFSGDVNAYIGLEYSTGQLLNVNTGQQNDLYTNWDTSEPSSTGCVYFSASKKKWKISNCATQRPVLCSTPGKFFRQNKIW